MLRMVKQACTSNEIVHNYRMVEGIENFARRLHRKRVISQRQTVVQQISQDLPDFLAIRQNLVDMLRFLETKCVDTATCKASELLADRMQNLRALRQ